MAVQTGFVKPKNRIVVKGTPHVVEKFVKTASNAIPGRLATRDTTDAQIKVCGASDTPVGWISYERTGVQYRKDARTTAYDAGDAVGVETGAGVHRIATVAGSQTIVVGDRLVPGANGTLVKATALGVASGPTQVQSSAANGSILSGEVGAKMVVAIARESITTSTDPDEIIVEAVL